MCALLHLQLLCLKAVHCHMPIPEGAFRFLV